MNIMIVPGMLVCRSFLISVSMFFCCVEAIWLNPVTPVLFNVCCSVIVACCVLYPRCMGVFVMFAIM